MIRTFSILLFLGLFASSASSAEAAESQSRVLVVVPLGGPDKALVKTVVDSLKQRFHFEVRVYENQPLPKNAWYQPRKRWRAEKLLDFLDELPVGEDVWRVAAITEEPISTTKGKIHDWGIAGLGSLGGKSSVFTSYLFGRYKKRSPQTYRRFMENLVLHEVGHTLGLDHCPLDRCIMADAKGNAIRAAKKSINEFCPMCFKRIRRYLKAERVQGKWTEEEMAALSRALFER